MMHVNANGLILGAIVSLVVICGATSASAATHPPLTTSGGVVASDDAQASKVGAEVLEKGGSAVDAAIATALALGVVSPGSSGLGGGGFAVIYVAKDKKLYALDFREVGPAAITQEHYKPGGTLDPSLAQRGGLAVGVPGELAGLEHMWKRHGQLPWSTLVEPAQGLAELGFRVSWFLAHVAEAVLRNVGAEDAIGRWLQPKGKVLSTGRLVRRSALARTLQAIAAEGSKGFYGGEVARDMVETVKRAGGVLSMADLAQYKVVERAPLLGEFAGMRVATMPLPSSGGVLLLEMLGILDAGEFDLAAMGQNSSGTLHVLAELLKHGFADRARLLGDDSQSQALIESLLDPKRLRRLATRIDKDRVQALDSYGSKELGARAEVPDDEGTSHLCVIDAAGNAVALTTTVNGYLGSKLVAPKSGVVLNNQMDDFSLQTGSANMFGLVQSERNLVGPGKRPLSSMTPTLLLDEDGVVGCFGASGGPRIISGTFQSILNAFVFGRNVRQAVSAPRLHHQWKPDKLYLEDEFSPDVVKALQAKGQNVVPYPFGNAVQAIIRRDGRLQAASDPRKGGAPAATAP